MSSLKCTLLHIINLGIHLIATMVRRTILEALTHTHAPVFFSTLSVKPQRLTHMATIYRDDIGFVDVETGGRSM